VKQQEEVSPAWSELWPHLEEAGVSAARQEARERLVGHMRLIEEWNTRAGLVAPAEIDHLWVRHVVDSVSLLPYLPAGEVLDIGSGGGYPAVPLASLLPHTHFTCLERNSRKISFLRRAITVLGLSNVTLVQGAFPEVPVPVPAGITARAVERPDGLVKKLAQRMPHDAVYLCQTRQEDSMLMEWFHVEHVEDVWSRQGWRRGSLRLLRPRW
jgi:16S rRNA (guanine527-N7)-methyltransferase